MKTIKPISLHSQLIGDSVTFLKQEGMECLITQEGMVDLINQLVYYKEEGRALYPEIYIFDDLDLIKKVLPTNQFCHIGSGDKVKETMLKALKKCAPLSENGWAIYILRNPNSFDYGVFRAGTSILSVSISETLIDNGSAHVKAILIHQVAEKLIEVKGVKADSLIVSFGSQDQSKLSPTENQLRFIDSIVTNVEPAIKDQTITFFRKAFLNSLQKGHGTLACVVKSNKKMPKQLKDGIQLSIRLDVPKSIKELADKNDLQANAYLEGQFSLITGMMQSDGITVFSDNGEVLSYNVFIKHPTKLTNTKTSGGARSRTFITLCDMVGKEIEGAYIQSQDGKIEFKNNG